MRISPQPTSIQRFSRVLCALVAFSLLAGCGLDGDFGEVNPARVNDNIHDWIGRNKVAADSIPLSEIALTDEERAMRDLAFPLIEPPYDRQRWGQVAREYGLVRTSPAEAADRSAYINHLMATNDRSQSTRYVRLIDDVRNDLVRLPAFYEAATKVLDLDEKRRKSMAYVSGLGQLEKANVLNRIRENARVVARVDASLTHRAASFRYALEHLVIAVPSPLAIDAERAVNQLYVEISRYRGQPTPTWQREPNLAFQR